MVIIFRLITLITNNRSSSIHECECKDNARNSFTAMSCGATQHTMYNIIMCMNRRHNIIINVGKKKIP